MRALALCTFSLCLISHINLLDLLAVMALKMHSSCLEWTKSASEWSGLYQTLACGGRAYELEHYPLLQSFGLVHLFVFSGAHIVLAEKCLRVARTPKPLIGLALLALSLGTNLSPPAVRAFFAWGLRQLNSKYELNWGPGLSVGLSCLICLALKPEWWQSLSLPLSWVAALALSRPLSPIKQAALVYLMTLPLLTQLTPASPLAIMWNILFSPLFLSWHFPLSWLAGWIHSLQFLADPLWSLTFKSLEVLNIPLAFDITPGRFHPAWQWIYVFSLQYGIYLFRERKIHQTILTENGRRSP